MPEVGAPAPDFSGVTQDGEEISLSDFEGKKLALYFYPRDNTPGCTRQACNLRDNFSELEKQNIAIVGVSDDPVDEHVKFANKYDLPFPLIADTDRAVLHSYGTYGQKNLYGRIFMGTKRTTFLIDEDGMIRKIIKRPKVGEHADEIIKGFQE
jgi:peroxiredoxin Q/BCP